MKKKLFIFLSSLFAVIVFYYLFSTVSLKELLRVLREIDLKLLGLFLCLSFFMNIMRVWRYQLLLNTVGERTNSFLLFLVVLIRNVFSDLLPARIGTIVYIYLVNSRLNIKLSAASSSFALAFLFDILAMPVLIISAVLLTYGEEINLSGLLLASLALFVITSLIIFFLPKISRFLGKYFAFFRSITNDLEKCNNPKVYFKVFIISIFVRAAKYLALLVFLVALLIPMGYEFQEINQVKAIFGMIAAEAAASLPVGSIGGFGAYEGAWSLTFNLMGFPEKVANLTAIMHHLFTQIYGYGLGIIAAILLLLPLKRFINIVKLPKGLFMTKLLISSVTLLLLYIFMGLIAEPKMLAAESDYQQDEYNTDFLIKNNLTIVFDSNKSGSFGVYQLGKKLQTIADTPSHEIYPDVSVDGKIVYAKHDTFSRLESGEIWIKEEGLDPYKIIENGTFPTFSSKGKKIYFERGRNSLWSYNLITKKEKLVFPNKQNKYQGYAVVKPRVSPNGKYLTFTGDREGKWHAYFVEIKTGKVTMVSHGCEPAWYDNSSLVFIKQKDVLGGSGIYKYDLSTKQISKLQDILEPFGHEYFPTISMNKKYLIFGAAPKDQHDHNTANYQLFIKDLEKGEIVKISNNPFTNRWPKQIIPK